MDREVMHLRDSLIPRYAELVYYGYWFAPERLALQAFVTESQKNVTGTVRVKLYKGQHHGRRPQNLPLASITLPSLPWKLTPQKPTTRTMPLDSFV